MDMDIMEAHPVPNPVGGYFFGGAKWPGMIVATQLHFLQRSKICGTLPIS
jgi:hypothetical protein